MKSILFISHDASRTGAPIILLNFLKWFKANSNIPFQILLKNGGELEPEFEAIAPVTIFNPKSTKKTLIYRILKRFGCNLNPHKSHFKNITTKLNKANIGLIYSNTATNGEVLEFLSAFKCLVISHVHELEWTIRYYAGLDNFSKVKNYTDQYIAVSESVKNNLIKNHDVLEAKINTIYEFIPQQYSNLNCQQTRESICQQLNIPQEAKIICASGTTGWRKGTDLFVQLASAVAKKYFDHPVYFLWIGGEKEGSRFGEFWHDVQHLGLEKSVHFLGVKLNPLDYFAACDIFAMVSREDPYPLVCLEAASVGKPIVCFDKAGGVKEFVEDDCGFVVSYLDIETMASKIVHLFNSPELCQSFGQRAQQKVKDRHNIEATAPKILQVIENSLLS